MSKSNFSRRRFLKTSITGAIVVVVAGVGAYLALQQPQPQPPPPAPVSPSRTLTPAVTPTPTSTPAVTTKPSPTLVDKANEEGAVMLYSSFDIELLNDILGGFMKKYPKIKAEVFRALGAQLLQRYQTEYRAGKHILDTFLGSSTFIFPALEDGIVAQYDSPEAKVFSAELKDPQGLWTAVQYSPQAIAYNTQYVKGTDIPTTYWDLLNPRFKDKIGVFNPVGSPHALLISKRKITGPERWMEWLRGLKAQNPKATQGTPQLMTMLKQGEVHLGLWSYTGSVTVSIREGAPVDYVRKPNTMLAPPSIEWIYKHAPHPNAARLLYDYILSVDGQTVISDTGMYILTRPGIPPKMGLGIGTGETVRLEYVASVWPFTQKELDEAAADWKSIFPVA